MTRTADFLCAVFCSTAFFKITSVLSKASPRPPHPLHPLYWTISDLLRKIIWAVLAPTLKAEGWLWLAKSSSFTYLPGPFTKLSDLSLPLSFSVSSLLVLCVPQKSDSGVTFKRMRSPLGEVSETLVLLFNTAQCIISLSKQCAALNCVPGHNGTLLKCTNVKMHQTGHRPIWMTRFL